MNELIQTQQNENGDILVSGRELHEFLEVSSNYTTWMNRMTEYGFEEEIDFIPFLEKSSGGRPSRDHHLKLDMAKEISMLQRTDKGKQARQYFLNLERMWNSPEMVIKRAMDFQQQKIEQLETQIKDELPYTNFGKTVSNSSGSINIGAFTKIIYDKHGINIGRNKMFEWLRERGFLIKHGREKNNPKQQYIEQGLFESVPTVISNSSKGDIQKNTTLITGKGQVKIANMLLEEVSINN